MKLIDLDPRWYVDGEDPAPRNGMGITFWCPHCRKVRLGVSFANPIDGGRPEHMVPHHDGHGQIVNASPPEWTRVGDTFETLTLSPSINASASGHWHGFIQNGAIA